MYARLRTFAEVLYPIACILLGGAVVDFVYRQKGFIPAHEAREYVETYLGPAFQSGANVARCREICGRHNQVARDCFFHSANDAGVPICGSTCACGEEGEVRDE